MYLMLLCFLHSKKERQCKNVFDAKMYLMRTFCFASHFPKENVQHQQNVTNAFWLCKNAVFFALQKTKMLCKNAFDAKII